MVLLMLLGTWLLWAQCRRGAKLFPQTARVAAAMALSVALIFSGIGCGSAGSSGGSSQSTAPGQTGQTVATPSIQPNGGVFGAAQSVSITDATSGAINYYTTERVHAQFRLARVFFGIYAEPGHDRSGHRRGNGWHQ
jgi:hypothetical protein